MLLLNILLALAWVVLTSDYSPGNFAVGFFLAYLILRLTQQNQATSRYGRRIQRIVLFVLYFLKEVVVSSLRVAVLVLSPKMDVTPAVVAFPLTVRSEAAITLLGNLITLTPGTLTIDVSTDRKVMYVHTIDGRDVASFRQSIAEGFERRILEIMR